MDGEATSPRPVAAMPRFQSILIPVAEAEELVEPFRRTGDWSSAHGIPAHMTIAGPWPLSVQLPLAALRNLGAAINGERYTLASAGALGNAICLFPHDDGTLLRWRAEILKTVAIPDDIDDQWRIHLTVCRPSSNRSAGTIEAAVATALPLSCEVGGLLLAQMHGESQVTVQAL
jgi:2'-5' RNA ligase superfamily